MCGWCGCSLAAVKARVGQIEHLGVVLPNEDALVVVVLAVAAALAAALAAAAAAAAIAAAAAAAAIAAAA